MMNSRCEKRTERESHSEQEIDRQSASESGENKNCCRGGEGGSVAMSECRVSTEGVQRECRNDHQVHSLTIIRLSPLL